MKRAAGGESSGIALVSSRIGATAGVSAGILAILMPKRGDSTIAERR
jgi:hypothetical protein